MTWQNSTFSYKKAQQFHSQVFIQEKQEHISITFEIDEFLKQYVKGRKPDTKEYLPTHTIYVKFKGRKKKNYIIRNYNSGPYLTE